MLTALINIRQTNKNQKKTKPKNANCAQKGSEAKITIQMTNFFRNLMATPEKNERHHTDEAQQQQNNGAQYDEPWLLDDIWTMVFVDGGLVTAAAWMSTWRCHQMCWIHCQCHLIFCFFFFREERQSCKSFKEYIGFGGGGGRTMYGLYAYIYNEMRWRRLLLRCDAHLIKIMKNILRCAESSCGVDMNE